MNWFKKPKIQLFVRHCHFSEVSHHKKRPKNFSKKALHDNLLSTLDSRVQITYLLDAFFPMEHPHFIREYPHIEIKEGTETGSFLQLLDHVEKQDFPSDTILYFLEDDYLHKPGWVDILLEGFTLPVDYITLYDHRDKYTDYPDLTSKIFHTKSCHWRTTPSTTNTYAMRWKTLQEDLAIHREFSCNCKVTRDHEKFLCLGAKGRTLVSSLPGWSTHAEPAFSSPCHEWWP